MDKKENNQRQNSKNLWRVDSSEVINIQEDITTLIDQINEYIYEPHSFEQGDSAHIHPVETPEGPMERYIRMISARTNYNPISVPNDGVENVEMGIDWSATEPILQKHIHDLERLHALNIATSTLIARLQKLTRQGRRNNNDDESILALLNDDETTPED